MLFNVPCKKLLNLEDHKRKKITGKRTRVHKSDKCFATCRTLNLVSTYRIGLVSKSMSV